MKNGFITTEQLEKQYGYNHPPRAARDVREAGIPLETFRVKSKDGRNIAAYRFGDLTKIKKGKLHGRQVFSKGLKDKLYYEFSGNCSICNGHFENRYLQVDHRVPYEISGDPIDVEQDQKDFMLLCGSCNRAKSWSCKHCENWKNPPKYVSLVIGAIQEIIFILLFKKYDDWTCNGRGKKPSPLIDLKN